MRDKVRTRKCIQRWKRDKLGIIQKQRQKRDGIEKTLKSEKQEMSAPEMIEPGTLELPHTIPQFQHDMTGMNTVSTVSAVAPVGDVNSVGNIGSVNTVSTIRTDVMDKEMEPLPQVQDTPMHEVEELVEKSEVDILKDRIKILEEECMKYRRCVERYKKTFGEMNRMMFECNEDNYQFDDTEDNSKDLKKLEYQDESYLVTSTSLIMDSKPRYVFNIDYKEIVKLMKRLINEGKCKRIFDKESIKSISIFDEYIKLHPEIVPENEDLAKFKRVSVTYFNKAIKMIEGRRTSNGYRQILGFIKRHDIYMQYLL